MPHGLSQVKRGHMCQGQNMVCIFIVVIHPRRRKKKTMHMGWYPSPKDVLYNPTIFDLAMAKKKGQSLPLTFQIFQLNQQFDPEPFANFSWEPLFQPNQHWQGLCEFPGGALGLLFYPARISPSIWSNKTQISFSKYLASRPDCCGLLGQPTALGDMTKLMHRLVS